jgi:hypothetical protein
VSVDLPDEVGQVPVFKTWMGFSMLSFVVDDFELDIVWNFLFVTWLV